MTALPWLDVEGKIPYAGCSRYTDALMFRHKPEWMTKFQHQSVFAGRGIEQAWSDAADLIERIAREQARMPNLEAVISRVWDTRGTTDMIDSSRPYSGVWTLIDSENPWLGGWVKRVGGCSSEDSTRAYIRNDLAEQRSLINGVINVLLHYQKTGEVTVPSWTHAQQIVQTNWKNERVTLIRAPMYARSGWRTD